MLAARRHVDGHVVIGEQLRHELALLDAPTFSKTAFT
jgi:hypothetical protein